MAEQSPEMPGQSARIPDTRPPAKATSKSPRPQPRLQCPFCGGSRFDIGRDVYAGPDQAMYCRKTPPAGERPEEGFSLPVKGTVCLTCGYVAMMVDINQLQAPIRRPRDAVSALARQARAAAAQPARSLEDEAAEALGKLSDGPRGSPFGPVEALGEPAQGQPQDDSAGVDFGELSSLLDEAERQLGVAPKETDANDTGMQT